MKEKDKVQKFEDPYTDYNMTRDEIGKRLGVSRQTVAEIEKRVLDKLRKAFKKAGIKKDDYV
jgi:DNA-binding XRE family transcriptional regulator